MECASGTIPATDVGAPILHRGTKPAYLEHRSPEPLQTVPP